MTEERRQCKNCGAELRGEYCSSCGQHDKELNRPVHELLHEVGEEIFSFDQRLVRSIKPFLLKPGSLTLSYVSGKRKLYISPFKLYFFISFVFFLTGSLKVREEITPDPQKVIVADTTAMEEGKDSAFVSVGSSDGTLRFTVRDSAEVEKFLGGSMLTSLRKLKSNPELLFEKMREHRPKVFFLLLPIFALLLKALYVRSGILYIQHLVFAFYFHSFLFFILFLVEITAWAGIEWLESASLLFYGAVPVHLYGGLKRVYGQGAGKTLVKLLLLAAAYGIAFFIAILSAAVILIIVFY